MPPAVTMREESYESRWSVALLITVASVAVLVSLEWLFLATGNSFLKALPLRERLLVLLRAQIVPAFAAAVLVAMIWIVARPSKRLALRGPQLLLIIPAVVLTIAALLLVDNFTLTVWQFGIRDAHSWTRAVYVVGAAGVFVYVLRELRRVDQHLRRSGSRSGVIVAGWLVILAAAAAIGLPSTSRASVRRASPAATAVEWNVLLIGADGVDARELPLYGYPRDTAPTLTALSMDSLVFDHAYTNSNQTYVSTVSLLTGRLPLDTGVLHRMHILSAEDSFLNLPALLRQRGYRTAQFTIEPEADAFTANVRGGFDEANGRRETPPAIGNVLEGASGIYASQFLQSVARRIDERLVDLLRPPARIWIPQRYRKPKARPVPVIGSALTVPRNFDSDNVDRLLEFIGQSDGPFFAHLFLLSTHGPDFSTNGKQFLSQPVQREEWQTDFYDQSILDADAQIARVLESLRRSGQLDRTIVVFYSDHGKKWAAETPVPLIIRLPHGAPRGRSSENVQNLDIAPTVLDALRLPKPSWMHGRSLLRSGVDPCRPIITVLTAEPGSYERLMPKVGNRQDMHVAARLGAILVRAGTDTYRYKPFTDRIARIVHDPGAAPCSSWNGITARGAVVNALESSPLRRWRELSDGR